jgi:CheY-like chemotaxis protein
MQQMASQKAGMANMVGSTASQTERSIVADIIARSLCSLGYQTRIADNGVASAIEAYKGHELRLVAVDNSLMVMRDCAGLGDSSCLATNSAIREECQRNGLYLDVIEDYQHGDETGGSLITAAARQHTRTLAEGCLAAMPASSPHQASAMAGGIYNTACAGQPGKIAREAV